MNKTYNPPNKLKVDCLACGDPIHVGNHPKVGSILICRGCEAELVIVKVDPLRVDWPEIEDDFGDYEEEEFTYEDFDDDDYDYDDDDDPDLYDED